MLKNVKSNYMVLKIFSFVNEIQKLKIIKYNKNLQNKINISIINYKHFNGKYIIYESKGKEYDGYNNTLLYEGEYLNGERYGKGKEYNNYGNIIYDGEYLKGKKLDDVKCDNNKNLNYIKEIRKEYYDNGKLKFECEYINGLKNGKGKEYNIFGDLTFEGVYFFDKLWSCKNHDIFNKDIYELKDGKGFIKVYYINGNLASEYEYSNGEKNGKGKEYNILNYKLEFENEYLNGMRNGKRKEYNKNGNLKF